MIHITGKWYIAVDSKSYTVMCVSGKDKEGKTVYKVYGYYGSLKNALNGLMGAIERETLSEVNVELKEAIEIIERTEAEINLAISQAIPEREK